MLVAGANPLSKQDDVAAALELIPPIIGGCEATTTLIIRLEAMNRAGELKFPMIRVNNVNFLRE